MVLGVGRNEPAWLSPEHADTCGVSCPRCLREYGNLPYHGLLDWRLAFDMLRIAVEGNAAIINLRGVLADQRDNPWLRLVSGGGDVLAGPARSFGYTELLDGPDVRLFTNADGGTLLESHPLWTDDHPAIVKARTCRGAAVRLVNPFRIARRPGDFAIR
jgi:hypothetical protein